MSRLTCIASSANGGESVGAFILLLHQLWVTALEQWMQSAGCTLTVMLFNTIMCPWGQRSVHIMVKCWVQAKSIACVCACVSERERGREHIYTSTIHTHTEVCIVCENTFVSCISPDFIFFFISAKTPNANPDYCFDSVWNNTSIPRKAKIGQLEKIVIVSISG